MKLTLAAYLLLSSLQLSTAPPVSLYWPVVPFLLFSTNENGQPFYPLYYLLEDKDTTINKRRDGNKLNIEMRYGYGPQVESVEFVLEGPVAPSYKYRCENFPRWFLAGNHWNNEYINSFDLPVGDYTLNTTSYTEKGCKDGTGTAQEKRGVSFHVIDEPFCPCWGPSTFFSTNAYTYKHKFLDECRRVDAHDEDPGYIDIICQTKYNPSEFHRSIHQLYAHKSYPDGTMKCSHVVVPTPFELDGSTTSKTLEDNVNLTRAEYCDCVSSLRDLGVPCSVTSNEDGITGSHCWTFYNTDYRNKCV